MIAGSFLLYLAYPVILLLLPLSASAKAGAMLAIWGLSWVVFSAGVFLTGPEGYGWLKGASARLVAGFTGKGGGKIPVDERSQ